MIVRAEGLALVAERYALYAMPASGIHRFQPLALRGPTAVVMSALIKPSDRDSLASILAATYANDGEMDFEVATDRILDQLFLAGLIVETEEPGALRRP